jgi:hypothetical protein
MVSMHLARVDKNGQERTLAFAGWLQAFQGRGGKAIRLSSLTRISPI